MTNSSARPSARRWARGRSSRRMAEESAEGAFSGEEREHLGRSEFAICVGTFYGELAERLLNGAVEGFEDGGVTPASVHTRRSRIPCSATRWSSRARATSRG